MGSTDIIKHILDCATRDGSTIYQEDGIITVVQSDYWRDGFRPGWQTRHHTLDLSKTDFDDPEYINRPAPITGEQPIYRNLKAIMLIVKSDG